jgi:hypothetical protein
MESMDLAVGIMHEVMSELLSRKGFSGWWDGIDDDIKEEIKDALIITIDETIRNSK